MTNVDPGKVCAEIQIFNQTGNVHSDLDPTDRELLHTALDEWLNTGNSTGYFYVANPNDLACDLREERRWSHNSHIREPLEVEKVVDTFGRSWSRQGQEQWLIDEKHPDRRVHSWWEMVVVFGPLTEVLQYGEGA